MKACLMHQWIARNYVEGLVLSLGIWQCKQNEKKERIESLFKNQNKVQTISGYFF